jgi:GH43 family beta-xylosidase
VLAGALAPAALANPVVPGDHPDPSLLRTAGGWYVTSTSGEWLPAFPILHSTDLRRWRQVGSVLMRRPRWAVHDFWAPELVRRGGRALVYYAAQTRSGRRCLAVASAARVRGPYTDHGPILCSRIGEIDPLPVRDEQGADWLVWKRDGNSRGRPTPILAAPLAPGGMSLAAPPHELFRANAAWERGLVEAPALLRQNGTFYMVYSAGRCCGQRCNYATGVARSASLLGPWEKRPEPILTGGGGIRCPGHVGIARGPGGEPVLAYHAYVRGDPSNRQLLMAPLRFDAAGWPQVEHPHGVVPRPPAESFEFGSELSAGWEWPSGPRPVSRVVADRLVLGRGALTRQTGTTRFSATTVIAGRSGGARAGLAVVAADGNEVGIELGPRGPVAWRADEGRRTTALKEVSVLDRGSYRPPGQDSSYPQCCRSPVELRVSVGRQVTLALKLRGRWQRVGAPQPLPRWASGARVALTVRGPAGARAEFESLSIDPR